jgi:predicted metal-binding membrane protein
MAQSSLRVWAIWLLKGNLVMWAVNALLLVVLVLLGSTLDAVVSSAYFSKITLLETGITFLVAGAVAFSGSVSSSKTREYIRKTDEKWSMDKLRKSEKSANKYIVLAALFFVESLIVSFLGV